MKSGRFKAVHVFPNIQALWEHHHKAKLILIDMPIGLVDKGTEPRGCDRAARGELGLRRSSVFPAPLRGVLGCETYEQACALNHKRSGKKISKQTWSIVPKIKELDTFMRGNEQARKKVRESHPEVCFTMLAGGKPMEHPKKTAVGFMDRLHLIERFDPSAQDWVRQAADDYPPKQVATDDVIDAMILAIVAAGGERNLQTLPANPQVDGKGLAMEIVYRQG